MNARIVTAWDGNNVWLQWEEGEGPFGIFMRFRPASGGEWSDWQLVRRERRQWAVVPTWREGYEVEALIVDARGDETEATPAKFAAPRCRFGITNDTEAEFVVPAGSRFHCMVDGAPSAYRVDGMLRIPARSRVEVELTAQQETGWNQLDYPGQFRVALAAGVLAENIEPSVRDLADATSRVIESVPVGSVLTIAVAPREEF